jgi:hypothetical protein
MFEPKGLRTWFKGSNYRVSAITSPISLRNLLDINELNLNFTLCSTAFKRYKSNIILKTTYLNVIIKPKERLKIVKLCKNN